MEEGGREEMECGGNGEEERFGIDCSKCCNESDNGHDIAESIVEVALEDLEEELAEECV